MKRLPFATFIFFSTAAIFSLGAVESAEVKLELDGAYGNSSQCTKGGGGKHRDEMARELSSTGYRGYEWACKFVWSHKEAGEAMGAYHGSTVWSVITLCAGEGEAYTELLSIQQYEDTVTISDGKSDPLVLKRCK